MSILRLAVLAPLAVAAMTTTASAWKDTTYPYAWDKGCKGDLCFAPYTAYQKGHYSYLRCKHPHKYLTYVGNELKCVWHKKVAK